ncbi:MAG: trypsin-like peptidase domain-containing protein [Pirellulales bacterium]|nr:trypsin-like peptidase domain-containing protein [Pirellulales bacterium]
MSRRKTLLLCAGCLTVGIAAGLMLSALPEFQPATYAQIPHGSAVAPPAAGTMRQLPPPVADDLTPQEQINVRVYENTNRSVVNITTRTVQSGRFFMVEVPYEGVGEGSGVVIDRQGHVVTNGHVVEGAQGIQVTLFDGKSYDAELVGHDPVTDVAVLKINAPEASLHPVVLGSSSRLKIGQHVYAIGNPFGFERTLTTGIISSLNRSLPGRQNTARRIKSLIQIDAAINPGNSGGPLLDSRGRMIGMNTAIASHTGESAGVGFAIPINTINRVVPQLIQNGRVIRADIGILTVYPTRNGLLIRTLAPGGPAERAGLRGPQVIRRRKQQGPIVYQYETLDRSAADLIVGIDGQPVTDADEFMTYIESKEPGDQVTLAVVRDGRRTDVPVQLAAGED